MNLITTICFIIKLMFFETNLFHNFKNKWICWKYFVLC